MERQAIAHWVGNIKSGQGELTSDSGLMDSTPFSFSTRFESEKGVNPEELMAAAHAACFTMALAGALTKKSLEPESLRTTCHVTVKAIKDGFEITNSRLSLQAKVSGIDRDAFEKVAQDVKESCPVSKALKIEKTLEIHFEGSEDQVPLTQ